MEINKLVGQLTDPSLKKDEKAGIVNQINEALSKTGEDNLTSYIATLSQLEELAVADIDISGIIPEDMPGLKNFEDLKGYLDYIKEEAPELYSVLAEALPDEVDRVTEEMGVSIGSVTIADGVMLPEIPGLEGIIEKARKGDSVTWEGDRPAIEAIATHIIDNIPEEERTLEEKALVNAVLNADSITDGSMQQAIDTYLATIEPTPIRVPIEMEGFNQFILDDAVREASYNVDRFNIGFSASEGIGQIADDINRFNQAAKDMKGTDLEGLADWSEPIASITMIPRENVDNMLTFLSQYRAMLAEGKVPDEETQAYADSITGLFSALSQMELPEDKQDILDNFLAPFLDAFGAADGDSLATYIEGMNALGGDLIAGVAEGMTSAELATVAETVMANLETALREAAESKSPAKRFNPLGDDISAGVGEGAEDYDFSTDAEKVIGNMESALKAAITGTGDGDGFASLGAMIAAALGAGMSGYDFSGSAGTTIGNIKGSIRGAAQIASPAKLFIPDGGFIGAGVGVGMSRYDFRPSARETVQHIAQALMGEEMQPVLVPDYVGRAETIREENMARSYGGGGRNVPAGGDTTHNSNYDMGGINIHNPQFRNEADMYRMMELMDEETRRKIAGVGN